jgi:release factor glutamine methyltransferase
MGTPAAPTVAALLAQARALGVARLDAQRLVAERLGRSREWVIAHDDAVPTSQQTQALLADLHARADGVPLAYLLGEREFHGLVLHVSPAVLVPRPETELLVDWALELGPPEAAAEVVDLGTGSGAIALALAHARPRWQLAASDRSAAALDIARRNGQRLGLAVDWALGDWWAAWPGRRFGLAVSNPPYIAAGDPHLPALRHEPRAALTPEGDGLAALAAIVAGTANHLLPGGWLLLEHGHDQGAAVRGLLAAAGFEPPQTRCDLAGLERCTGARWNA